MSNFAKIVITGELKVESGLHIGASDAFSAIGAIDSPVIRDSLTNLPMIPGSSLKGKMRSLLAKDINVEIAKSPAEDHPTIKRLFGATVGGDINDGIVPSQLLFRDLFLINQEELDSYEVDSYTEAKFENKIDRVTMVATPRQIERVIKGAKFGLTLVYEVIDIENIEDDFKTIAKGLKLLTYDYLGGSGSRGYGQVSFNHLKSEVVYGNVDNSYLNQLLGEEI